MGEDLHSLYWGVGSVDDAYQSFFKQLQKARPNVPGLDRAFISALFALVRLADRQGMYGRMSAQKSAEFRDAAKLALTPFKQDVAEYVRHIEVLAEGAREEDDDWFKLAQRRSAVQILLDDLEASLTSTVDREHLDRIDGELRRIGREQGPLDADRIPVGIPSSHWWWWYPQPAPP